MYLRYAEQTKTVPARQANPKVLRRILTVVFFIMGALAAYEVFAFAQEYLRALGT